MKFVKNFVPDKRWQNNRRPIVVNGNPLIWFFWKLLTFFKDLLSTIKQILEKSFTETNDFEQGDYDKEE